MELKDLYPFVIMIVLIGMVIGVGVLTLDKFDDNIYYDVKNVNDTITPTNNTFTALAWGNITGIKSVKLARTQQVIGSNNYTIYSANGTFLLTELGNATCGVCNLTINGTDVEVVFDAKNYDTKTSSAVSSAMTEVSNIASNWLGLIVTVAVLALILFLVIRSFGAAGTGRRL